VYFLSIYSRKDNTLLVVQNEQAGAHKTTGATNRDQKETRNLQHKDQTSRRRASVENILTVLRHVMKTFKYRTCI
jgi:hypothetical protein